MVLKAKKPIQINANYRRTEKLLESGEIDIPMDGGNYVTEEEFESAMEDKQDILTPGNNITIENNVISTSSDEWVQLSTEEYTDGSIWDDTNFILKKEILIKVTENNLYTTTCILPKGIYKSGNSPGRIVIGYASTSYSTWVGSIVLPLREIFSDKLSINGHMMGLDFAVGSSAKTFNFETRYNNLLLSRNGITGAVFAFETYKKV